MKGYLDAFQKRPKTRFDGLDCILPKDLRKGVWKDDGAGRGRMTERVEEEPVVSTTTRYMPSRFLHSFCLRFFAD
jgi:hypothetical protein